MRKILCIVVMLSFFLPGVTFAIREKTLPETAPEKNIFSFEHFFKNINTRFSSAAVNTITQKATTTTLKKQKEPAKKKVLKEPKKPKKEKTKTRPRTSPQQRIAPQQSQQTSTQKQNKFTEEYKKSAPNLQGQFNALEQELSLVKARSTTIGLSHYERIANDLAALKDRGYLTSEIERLLEIAQKLTPDLASQKIQTALPQGYSPSPQPEQRKPESEQFTIAEAQEWVPDVLTQPLPKGASRTRLVLPAPIDKILLKKLGTFGAHQGGHIEGLDHEWMPIKNDTPIGSWGDGIVTRVEQNTNGGKIVINFGDGLFGEYMEIKTPLVKVGDTVKARQPIGYGKTGEREPTYQSGEFVLGDAHRRDGVGSWVTNGVAVSPFDYLEDAAKQELIDAFTKEVIEPYIAKGQTIETITPWEPYLTNPVLLHKNHKGTLVGEWLLMSKKWKEKDPASYEVITFLKPAPTKYYPRQRALGISNDIATDRLVTYFSGDVDIDYTRKNFSIYADTGILRGIFELDESGPRAKFKTEYRFGAYPESFSENALIYIERWPTGIRDDAFNLGMLEKR